MSELQTNLKNLKNKLESLVETKGIAQTEDAKQQYLMYLNKDVLEFLKKNDNKIKLEIGGEIFLTKISTLLSVENSLFSKIIIKHFEKENKFPEYLFFDRSYTNFNLIMDYLRTKNKNFKNLNKFIIDELLLEAEYYNLTEITEKLDELSKTIVYVKAEANKYYSSYGTKEIKDLSNFEDRTATKGPCIDSPYEYIIELNMEHEIDKMEVAGYNGKPGSWYPSYGSNAKVYTSTDKKTWVEVGAFPSSLTAEPQMVKLKKSICKYFKVKHTSYYGIGYLRLIKSIE